MPATDAKVITVESSPTEILATMTPAENKKWRETGDIPEAKTKTADPSPAAKTEPVGDPAASTTAQPEAKVATTKTVKNAETRIPELLSEIKRLNSEIEKLNKAPAAATTKKEEEIVKPRRNDVDVKTGQPLYANDDEFLDARDKYVADMASKQTRATIAKETQEARIAEQNRILQEKWQNSLKIATEAHPDFAKVCGIDDKGAFQNAELKKIKDGGALDRFCLDTPRGGDVLYYLASHEGEVDRIQAIHGLDDIAEALVDLKKQSLGTASTKQLEVVKTDDPEASKVAVSKAPAPATSVGGKATAPKDEIAAATEAGDFRRFKKAADEEEFRQKRKAS